MFSFNFNLRFRHVELSVLRNKSKSKNIPTSQLNEIENRAHKIGFDIFSINLRSRESHFLSFVRQGLRCFTYISSQCKQLARIPCYASENWNVIYRQSMTVSVLCDAVLRLLYELDTSVSSPMPSSVVFSFFCDINAKFRAFLPFSIFADIYNDCCCVTVCAVSR